MLNRPEVHNAVNQIVVTELTELLQILDRASAVRAVVIKGAGSTFCAGADINWMQRVATFTKAESLADSRRNAKMLATLASLSKPTIARVHGKAFGAGVGLVACCDIAIAVEEASFALSEVRLGLIPTTVGAYVVEAIGPRQARRFFMTGERIPAAEARRLGLVHEVVPLTELDARIDEILKNLLLAGPKAQAEAKKLIRAVAHHTVDARMISLTANYTTAIRGTPEAREGFAAFLSKRPPAWIVKPSK